MLNTALTIPRVAFSAAQELRQAGTSEKIATRIDQDRRWLIATTSNWFLLVRAVSFDRSNALALLLLPVLAGSVVLKLGLN